MRLKISIVSIFMVFASAAMAADLDSYYLQRFAGVYGGKSSPVGIMQLQSPPAPADMRLLTPLFHDLKRDWKTLTAATQGTLAKYLAKPVLSGEKVALSNGSHFKIHYASSGTDAPPAADLNSNGIPDWVETVASVFETVYSSEVTTLGYTAPPTNGGLPYDVYLQDLAATNQFGFTQSDTPVSNVSFTSYIAIDNDFLDTIYLNSIPVNPGDPASTLQLKALEVTAAHEFHHAIQYGYNFFFDVWFAEATSTWI
jgi:hypothetical protein